MASIHQIEVANFLCEDYENSKEWSPLYRGVTFRLFGQSTAFQIDNGGGKTSLSDAWLYLLSRVRRLKPKVEDRVAPADKGWTHIRIEFIEKPLDENILQSELITLTPEDAPGTTYVIGFCWNRGKDPFFYRYQGTLTDVPCYKQTENRLELVSNEAFRKSIEPKPGAVWNLGEAFPNGTRNTCAGDCLDFGVLLVHRPYFSVDQSKIRHIVAPLCIQTCR